MKRIALCLSVLFQLSAAAQEEDTSELLPVAVKAVRAAPTAPFAKTTLGRETIRRENLGRDLPYLLDETPSVVVNSDAGTGIGYTGLRIRGTDATRINVTLNGIPYNDAESGGTFFVNLPDFASSVQSVQIQRGVGTSTNGPGAFGATINFSTAQNNLRPYAEVNSAYGSFSTLKNTFRGGTGLLGQHFSADLRLSRISSSGYVDRASADLLGGFLSLQWQGRNQWRLYTFTGNERTYQAWYGVPQALLGTRRTFNSAGTERPGSPYENETDNYRQTHYQLFFDRAVGRGWTISNALFYTRGKGYYEQYKAGRSFSEFGLPDVIRGGDTVRRTDAVRQLWLDNHYYGTVFTAMRDRERSDITFGGTLSRYDGLHFGKVVATSVGPSSLPRRYYELPAGKGDLTLYGKWQQVVRGGLQFYTDLQFRHVGYSLNGFRNNPDLRLSPAYNFLAPKLGFSYSTGPWLLYTSYSVGRKEPNRDDFEAGLTQQPRPEHLRDLEAGIERKGEKASFSAGFYYMNYRDQLVLTGRINDVGAYTRTNIPLSYRLGTELQAGFRPARWLELAANLALSRNRIRNFTEYIDDYDPPYVQKEKGYPETVIAFSPAVVAGGRVTVRPLPRLEAALPFKYVGKQYLDNTGNEGRKIAPYFQQDAHFMYTLPFGDNRRIELQLQVNNVLHRMYAANGYTFSYFSNSELVTENFYFPMAGRHYMAGVNIRL